MAGEREAELRPVTECLLATLSNRLGLAPQTGLSPVLVTAIARRIGLKGDGNEIGLGQLLDRMAQFGLDIQHIQEKRLTEGDLFQQYFLLDLANVLLHSIDQVKAARTSHLLSTNLEEAAATSSGGEEVVKILEEARKKYGRIRSFRKELDEANISIIPPQKIPQQVFPQKLPKSQKIGSSKSSISETSDVKDTTDHTLMTKAQPKPKRRKLSKEAKKIRKDKSKENIAKVDENDDESDHEINVNIPISDTTDVKIMVKPLDNQDLKNQRIHVRVNQKLPTFSPKSKSRHIVYGTKSVLSHHLRKARSPMFSKRPTTPKLSKKKVLERVVDEVKSERRKADDFAIKEAPKQGVDFKLRAQKVLREKRTENANFRKIIGDL